MCKCVWWLAQSAYIQKSNWLQKPHNNFVLFRVIGLFICKTLNKSVCREVVVLTTQWKRNTFWLKILDRLFSSNSAVYSWRQPKKDFENEKKTPLHYVSMPSALYFGWMPQDSTSECIDSYLISGIESILIRKLWIMMWSSAEMLSCLWKIMHYLWVEYERQRERER